VVDEIELHHVSLGREAHQSPTIAPGPKCLIL
jgi:hypothetical protein